MFEGRVVFCEKRKMLVVVDPMDCWNCNYNVINGGVCYPWLEIGVEMQML